MGTEGADQRRIWAHPPSSETGSVPSNMKAGVMPKRVIDGEGIWGSTKLSKCPEWMRAEYAWLYPLADAYGCFELTSIAVIRGKVAPHRTKLTEKRLLQIFDEFHKQGLLFVWWQNGRKYGYWTGSDRKGRLPRPSRRSQNYEKVHSPPVPRKELRLYLQELGEQPERRLPDKDASSASASASAKALANASVPGRSAQSAFEKFWNTYPKGYKSDRPGAIRAWRKVKAEELPAILDGIKAWSESERWQGGYITDARTFLNRRMWESEPPKAKQENLSEQLQAHLARNRENSD